jgi:hypothetical protein
MLNLNADKVCFVIVKVRELDVQSEEATGDSSNDADDGFASVYTERADSSVRKELVEFIGAMDEDEQRELIALYLIGGEDYSIEEWEDALAAASSHPQRSTAAFLLASPSLSDQLEEGLSLFGLSCADFETGRL